MSQWPCAGYSHKSYLGNVPFVDGEVLRDVWIRRGKEQFEVVVGLVGLNDSR